VRQSARPADPADDPTRLRRPAVAGVRSDRDHRRDRHRAGRRRVHHRRPHRRCADRARVGADPGTVDIATGDVRVTLRWADTADLDLSVTDPAGETVSYGSRSVGSGGTLDVDANAACDGVTATPVENIIWPDTAPDGRYTIGINLYSGCGAADAHAFQLTALIGGVPVQVYVNGADGSLTPTDGTGTITSATPTLTFAFDRG
jgi:hypothetical protein